MHIRRDSNWVLFGFFLSALYISMQYLFKLGGYLLLKFTNQPVLFADMHAGPVYFIGGATLQTVGSLFVTLASYFNKMIIGRQPLHVIAVWQSYLSIF